MKELFKKSIAKDRNLVVVFDDSFNEVSVAIENNDGIIVQDVCLVREATKDSQKVIQALLWGNVMDEDYTEKYNIPIIADEQLEE